MAVINVGGGGGLLGSIGRIAGIGGMLIPGMQWLTPVGMGMSAVDAAMRGDPQAMQQVIGQLGGGDFGAWQNPATGNLAQPGIVNPLERLLKGMG